MVTPRGRVVGHPRAVAGEQEAEAGSLDQVHRPAIGATTTQRSVQDGRAAKLDAGSAIDRERGILEHADRAQEIQADDERRRPRPGRQPQRGVNREPAILHREPELEALIARMTERRTSRWSGGGGMGP